MNSGWVEDGFEDDMEEYIFRPPLHWRLRLWLLNDLARLRFWRG